MRKVNSPDQITPIGFWIREYVTETGMSVTNLDYVLEDFKRKKLMLLEEKQSGGVIHNAQRMTFMVLDSFLRSGICQVLGYEYWGFYVLQLPPGKTMPGPGMKLNNKVITGEQLAAHLSFEKAFCAPEDYGQLRVVDEAACLRLIRDLLAHIYRGRNRLLVCDDIATAGQAVNRALNKISAPTEKERA
jgi:hypothetical protein